MQLEFDFNKVSLDFKKNFVLRKYYLQGLLFKRKAFGNVILQNELGKDALGLRFFLLAPLSRNKLILHDNTDTSACATVLYIFKKIYIWYLYI